MHGVHAWVVDHRLNTLDGTPSLGIHILFKELLGLCIGAPALTHPIGAELFFDRGGKILVAHLAERLDGHHRAGRAGGDETLRGSVVLRGGGGVGWSRAHHGSLAVLIIGPFVHGIDEGLDLGLCEQLWADILRAGTSDNIGAHFIGSVVHIDKGRRSHNRGGHAVT